MRPPQVRLRSKGMLPCFLQNPHKPYSVIDFGASATSPFNSYRETHLIQYSGAQLKASHVSASSILLVSTALRESINSASNECINWDPPCKLSDDCSYLYEAIEYSSQREKSPWLIVAGCLFVAPISENATCSNDKFVVHSV